MLQANGITYEIETPDGPLKLLDNVSFNVPRGHFMAVVGPSGCGKTTLLKAIAGMIAETGGRFFWNGHDLAEEDFEPSEIGFVPQFSIAYDQLSVDENVESAARLRCRFNSVDDLDDSIDNALEVTGMEDYGPGCENSFRRPEKATGAGHGTGIQSPAADLR